MTTTTTWTYEGIRLLGYSAVRSDGATWALDYLYDERGQVFSGVYSASDATTTPFLMVTTDRGDVRELLDGQGGALGFYSYDAYGNPTAQESAATTDVPAGMAAAITERQVLRYAGYVWDAASGLYYCSQRYYDPETMQFISKDPARADGEESAYQYCGGDPVGKVDPSGEWGDDVHGDKTLRWARDVGMSRSGDIAKGDLLADRGRSRLARLVRAPVYAPVYKGGGANPEMHGYRGSEYMEKALFNQALSTWQRGDKKDAAELLGLALHTRQDVYAHRRAYVEYRGRNVRGEAYWNPMYEKTNATVADPKHTKRHDKWGEAYIDCQRKVEQESKALLSRFKSTTGS